MDYQEIANPFYTKGRGFNYKDKQKIASAISLKLAHGGVAGHLNLQLQINNYNRQAGESIALLTNNCGQGWWVYSLALVF